MGIMVMILKMLGIGCMIVIAALILVILIACLIAVLKALIKKK